MGKHLKVRGKMAQVVPFLQTGDYYFEKALRAYRQKDLYKAKKYLERAYKIDSNDPIILCQLATILTELGEYQRSNELLLSIIEHMDDQMADCYYFMANNFAHLGLFQEAQKYAKHYVEHFTDGDFIKEAEDLLDLLSIDIEDDEDEFDFHDDALILKQEKAKLLLEQTKFEEAAHLLTEIIEEYPEFWSAYNNLALAYFYLNQLNKAMNLLQEVLDKNPGNLHALCNQLIFYYYCHKREEVDKLVDGLSRVYPISIEHRYKLGATFALVGQYELAYKWLRPLYKQGFHGDVSFYYWLSYASYHIGFDAFAKEMWKHVLEDMPEKEGEEPWCSNEMTMELFCTKVNIIAKEKCASAYIHDQLYGLYMIKKLSEKERLLLLEDIKSSIHTNALLDEVYTYVWQDKQHVIFEVADLIEVEVEYEQDVQKLLSFWFYVYVHVYEQNYDFQHVNVNGWASAITYCWKKSQHEPVTQTEVAQLYAISTSTVRKYVKIVNTLLN